MINDTVYAEVMQTVTDPDKGCIALVQKCRDIASVGDPEFLANNQTVNEQCSVVNEACGPLLGLSEAFAQRHFFDMSQIGVQSFPGWQHVGFFNRRWVQEALGVPVNYTDNANLTALYFSGTSDPYRQTQASIEYLLERDVNVALVYGDRDTRCTWNGVENVSLTVEYPSAPQFRAAGYAELKTNNSYVGGVVRQYDGFSFSRIFEAGHQVSAFQPETVNAVFERVMFGRDVATGKEDVDGKSGPESLAGRIGRNKHYATKGPASSWGYKNVLPDPPLPACNIWAIAPSCTEGQTLAILNGTAVTEDFRVISPAL